MFITVVTRDRRPVLLKNIDLLRQSFINTKQNYDFDIFAVVVLPEHFHIIIKPNDIFEYPKIISSIKHYFSKNIDAVGQVCPTYKRNKGIWQGRYYEHTIINQEDLYNHLNYVHYNPVKHELVKNVKDWEHSSFHKFVQLKNYDINWGSFEDIKEIVELDYE